MSSTRQRPLGAVLAGGGGRRLGGAKAGAELAGRPLIYYPLAALGAAGMEAVVVAKADSDLPRLEVPLIEEPQRPRHPLCGIVAALEHAGGRPLVVVACDMPFVTARMLAWLAATGEPLVVPSVGGQLQPLLARYDHSLEPALAEGLARGAPLQSIVAGLDPRLIREEELARFGNPRRLCFNVNTRSDLESAERLLASSA
jgi:molybdopterin-guanine dinucleotide biosynthesis protein A